jgi:diheme cytochrome c
MRSPAAALLLCAAACGGSRPREPMSDSRRTYLSKCTSCHSAYQPAEYTPAQWSEVMDEMEKQKRVRLSPDERELILGYLSAGR